MQRLLLGEAGLTQQMMRNMPASMAMSDCDTLLPVKADPPQPAKLPPDDILGVTVLFLSCSYQGKVR